MESFVDCMELNIQFTDTKKCLNAKNAAEMYINIKCWLARSEPNKLF